MSTLTEAQQAIAIACLAELVDSSECRWDHNHSCQEHGFYYLDNGQMCPNERAKRLLKELEDETHS